MARRFLSSLRGKSLTPPSPGDAATEHKVVLGDYYSTLATSGSWMPSRVRPWPIDRAVSEGYERIVWVFKAVEAISANAARLPYRLKSGEETVDDHPLYRVLNQRANPMETGRDFRKRLCSQILLSKAGAFVEITLSNAGEVTRMDLLPPGRTRPVPGRDGTLIDHYEVIRADGTRHGIEPERVRWFREPHPTDPYSGVTPLEAAGMSAELDYFARLYNVSFFKNDARPGGVLAVNGEMDPGEMDRIEDRFKKGPTEAGTLTVINGEVSYVDLAARPRDLQYETLSKVAKNEVLCAFGVPESVLGYAADRSYANAEQEQLNFWQVTMPTWLDLMATGLDGDSSDDLEGFFDTGEIEVLQRAKAARREEARKEFEQGLISPDEYREIAGYVEIDMPKSRSLFVPSGRQIVATNEADAKEIVKEKLAELPPELAANAARPPAPPANGGVAERRAKETRTAAAPVPASVVRRNAAAVGGKAPARAGTASRKTALTCGSDDALTAASASLSEPNKVMRLVRPRERKAAALTGSRGPESDPDDRAHAGLEAELAENLTAVAERLLERAVARLVSPKSRKGTRHWEPDLSLPHDFRVGDKALDAARAVDETRWAEEAEEATELLVSDAAGAAAAALLADLAGDAVAPDIDRALPAFIAEIVRFIGGGAQAAAQRLIRLIGEADAAGHGLADIAEMLQGQRDIVARAMTGLAVQAATATLSGAREVAAQALDGADAATDIERMWRTRRDDAVRKTHQKVHGKHQPVGSPFLVGGAVLRFPGDPFGPAAEVFNCRCRLQYRAVSTGRFVAAPAAELALR